MRERFRRRERHKQEQKRLDKNRKWKESVNDGGRENGNMKTVNGMEGGKKVVD